MRRKLHVPQIAAVMGPCIAGGAYLPALSDVIIMVENTSFMGLGGPNLVKGATGQSIDAGIARRRPSAHAGQRRRALHGAKDDDDCLEMIRQKFRQFPRTPPPRIGAARANPPKVCTTSCPADHRLPYNMEEVLARIFDARII
jgi:3-methylcrotonyl-CoA carboxylase beta subunit